MVILELNTTKEAVLTRLRSEPIQKSTPPEQIFNLFLKNELCGGVREDTFWLMKTRPNGYRVPQRFFRGRVIPAGAQCRIEGKFVFSAPSICLFGGILLIAGLLLGQFAFRTLSSVARVGIGVCAAAMGMVLCLINGKLRFQQEEQIVLKYLERLDASDP